MRHLISNRAKNHGISLTPPLLSAITQECFTVKIIFQVISQLRLVGSHNTNLGAVAHGALELCVPIREALFFFVTLRVWIYLLRKGAYRDISHIILKHTQ